MNQSSSHPLYRNTPGRLLVALGICLFTLTAALLIPWPLDLLFAVVALGAAGGSAAIFWAALNPTAHPLLRVVILCMALLVLLVVFPTLAVAVVWFK